MGVAREMLLRGDWLVPTLNGAPFFHKPPLFCWITAASMHLFGTDLVAARAASILAAASATTGLFAYLRRWTEASRAWWAVIVLASAPLFYGGAQYANLDMLVAACIGGAVLLAARASNSRDAGQPYRVALASAFAVAAFGVLAKGLIGAVLPALVLVAWGLVTRRLIRILALLAWAPGVLLFFCVAAPWFVEVQARFPGFDHYFFVVQHFERFASMPSSKLIGYILPTLLPLAFLISDAVHHMARTWQRSTEGTSWRLTAIRARDISATLAVVICIGAVIAAHFFQPKTLRGLAQQMQAARRPGEPVIYIENYYYDVPFYAHLDGPVRVVDPWSPVEIANDSWRRELVDATRFAPAAVRLNLLHPDELNTSDRTALWHIVPALIGPGVALRCPPPVGGALRGGGFPPRASSIFQLRST